MSSLAPGVWPSLCSYPWHQLESGSLQPTQTDCIYKFHKLPPLGLRMHMSLPSSVGQSLGNLSEGLVWALDQCVVWALGGHLLVSREGRGW